MKRPSVLKHCRGGESVREVNRDGLDSDVQIVEPVAKPASERVPDETELQPGYDRELLFQVKVSFRCSLIFASIGFILMAVGAFMHSNADAGSMLGHFVWGGGISDAIAALFFIHSRESRRNVEKRLEQQRRDRNHAEALEQCRLLTMNNVRDAVRTHLVLHLSEVKNADENARAIHGIGQSEQIAGARSKD